jgi:hypothetical protein
MSDNEECYIPHSEHYYYKIFWYCDNHAKLYHSICTEFIDNPIPVELEYKNKNCPVWMSHHQYPKTEDIICGKDNYPCFTLYGGYRSYSITDEVLEDYIELPSNRRIRYYYLDKDFELSKLIEEDCVYHIKPAKH